MTTHEAEVLRAEADRIAALRGDAMQSPFDAHRELTVTATIEDSLDIYGRTQELARAYCWGVVVDCAGRADWETVNLVIAAYKARWQSDGVA